MTRSLIETYRELGRRVLTGPARPGPARPGPARPGPVGRPVAECHYQE